MNEHDDIPLEIDPRKIEAYLLSVGHPEGSGKAAYFIGLGYNPRDADRFIQDLRRHFACGAWSSRSIPTTDESSSCAA